MLQFNFAQAQRKKARKRKKENVYAIVFWIFNYVNRIAEWVDLNRNEQKVFIRVWKRSKEFFKCRMHEFTGDLVRGNVSRSSKRYDEKSTVGIENGDEPT